MTPHEENKNLPKESSIITLTNEGPKSKGGQKVTKTFSKATKKRGSTSSIETNDQKVAKTLNKPSKKRGSTSSMEANNQKPSKKLKKVKI